MFGHDSSTSTSSLRRLGAAAVAAIVGVLAACENPLPPTACGPLAQQTVNVGEQATVTACFNDPNGDILTYSVSSLNPSVATATVSGTTITVSALKPGNASVTVTASDPGGLQGQQSFEVVVPNRPPLPRGTISPITVQIGQTESLDVSSYFTEPDGEALTYGAASSNPSVAAVSVSGSTVRVTAVAKGNTTMTVTATDPGGLSATQTFVSTVPNRRPEPVGTISEQTVEVGDPVTFDLSPYFNDPDGDPLTFTARSSRTGVARVSVSGSTVTITARAKGTTNVTITATDDEGLSATQTFVSTVPNRHPEPVGTIPDQAVHVDETETVALSSYFEDPDGDPLTFTARSSRTGVARVSVSGSTVTITARAKGTTDVTITATDDEGLSATQSFQTTVPNRPPTATGSIPDQSGRVGETLTVDLSNHFDDPDGDALTYSATSSNSGVARPSVSGSVITITAVAAGTARLTVIARDGDGGSATQSFDVTVTQPNRAPRPQGTIPAVTLAPGGTATVNASNYFTDPDGDALTYTARSSITGVATVSVSGATVTIRAVSAGSATITITARDPGGLTATQRASVTVTQPNRAPRAVGTIPAVTLAPGGTATVNASNYFTDPDGDALTYTARSSNTGVATVSVSGATVTIRAVSAGSATITITARDPGGLTATQRASVTVTQTNRAPRAVGTIPAVTLAPGGTSTINASNYFTDPDGDALTYAASSSNTGVARVSVSGATVTITAVAAGSATVTITARDPGGLTATQRASVTVTQQNRAPRAVGSIPAVTLAPGGTSTINASNYFTDPDGDALTYTARSSNTGVATVSVSGATVTITAVSAGSATITITARDPGGLTATQRASVTVESSAAPDLTFTSVSPTSVTVAPGDNFEVRFTIRNRGDAAAAATTMRVYQSDNATISTSDREIGNNPFAALAAGISRTVRHNFTISSSSSPGTTYVGSCLDPVSGESDTDNNCSPSVRVTISDGGGGAGFRDDFNSSASLDDWEIANATAEVSGGVLELTTTTSNRLGVAERIPDAPITSWTNRVRMGRAQTNSAVSLIWLTGHARYQAFSFDVGSFTNNRNYIVAVFDNTRGWSIFSDLSGNSNAINEGANELTTIALSFANGRLKAIAGSTELFDVQMASQYAAALPNVTRIWLASYGGLGRTVLFDWIDVDGDAVGSSHLVDESPELQIQPIDIRELIQKAPDIILPSADSRGRIDPTPTSRSGTGPDGPETKPRSRPDKENHPDRDKTIGLIITPRNEPTVRAIPPN